MSNAYFARHNRQALAREALQRALQVRQQLGIKPWEAICAHDAAERLGIDVTFQNFPSMEGMYCQRDSRSPLIVLSSERPVGRQNFNCAHEIGHHAHGDGTRVDEFLDSDSFGEARHQKKFDPVEFRADRFASFLLMPKSAVDRAFALRQLHPENCEAEGLIAVSGWLGVGYRTLIEHLCFTLNAITQKRAGELRRESLPRLRAAIVGYPVKNVKVVDEHWGRNAIDLLAGDAIVMPRSWQASGDCLSHEGDSTQGVYQPGAIVRAIRQGQGSLLPIEGDIIPVRVSRQGYVGWAKYRHLDDPDEDK